MRLGRKPWLGRKALTILLIIVGPTLLVVHSVSASLYYAMNSSMLQTIAAHAVRTAAEHLPREPALAARIADECLKDGGVAADEIVVTAVSADNRTVMVVLNRKVPLSLAFLAVGLPSREISVTASARKQVQPPAAKVWKVLDYPAL